MHSIHPADASRTGVLQKLRLLHDRPVYNIAGVVLDAEVVELHAGQGAQPAAQEVVFDIEGGENLLKLVMIVLLPGLSVHHLVQRILVIIEPLVSPRRARIAQRLKGLGTGAKVVRELIPEPSGVRADPPRQNLSRECHFIESIT